MFEKCAPSWRDIMPIYNNFEWEGYKITINPTGIRKIFKFLPYWTGSKPRFNISIRNISGKIYPISSSVEFLAPDEPIYQECKELSMKESKPEIVATIGDKPIGLSGDYRVNISLGYVDSEDKCHSHNQSTVTFRAISQEIILGWSISAIIAIALLIVGIWNLVCLIRQ